MRDAPSLREGLEAGQPLLGCFAFLSSATVVEILGRAGLDFVIIDQEHSPKSWETVENMVRAAELCGMAALVRVARNDEKEILHALEVGAAGIVVPFVESASDVRLAASALRYPPAGTRGTCTQTRAAGFGAQRARFAEFAQQRNRELLLVGLIENRRGLENIDDIVGAEHGLDVVLIGRSDLATDMGRAGQAGDPLVKAATERICAAALAAGTRFGVATYSAEECEAWRARGCTFFAFPSESGLLFDAVASLRREVRQRWESVNTAGERNDERHQDG